MEEDGHGKRVSSSAVSSRLSAKAQPFRLNRFTAQPTWTSSLTSVDPCDSLIKSLSNVNLEEDPLPSASNFGLDSLQGSWFGQHSDSLACTNYAYETLLEQGNFFASIVNVCKIEFLLALENLKVNKLMNDFNSFFILQHFIVFFK